MTRADVRMQALLVADRPSRHVPIAPKYAPPCPRCDVLAVGHAGRWWCGECSAPVVVRS